MNTKAKRLRLIPIMLLAAVTATSVGTVGMATHGLVRRANAAEEPIVIEIKAKKFEFTPIEITLKKGEPVVLRITTEDRAHGFFLKPMKIDADIKPGQTTDIAVTPEETGQYTVICDHYCGIGHGNMMLTLTVVQ